MTGNAAADETIPMDPDKEARMLLNPPQDGVQFQQANQSTNGQVVLPINKGTSGVGMTKQELMRYANDPFWVRLRLFLFVLFWVVWLAMLIGAIAIVALAPGCPLTSSLPWWKKTSMLELKTGVTEGNGMPRDLAVKRVTEAVNEIKANLDSIKDMNVNTILLSGIDGYLLVTPPAESNTSRDSLAIMKEAIQELAQTEDIKLILGIELGSTASNFFWFTNDENNTQFADYYIVVKSNDIETPKEVMLKFKNVNTNDYTARLHQKPKDGPNDPKYARPVLNYAKPEVKEQVHQAILGWMKTKVDGIQVDGALYEYQESSNKVVKSKEGELAMHKAVKKAGQTKAFLVADAELSADAFKEGEEEASFDIAPDTSLWDTLAKSNDLKATLTDVFAKYVKKPEEAPKVNETEKAKPDRAEVGRNWRSYQVAYPTSKSNSIAKKHSVSTAEAITAAIYLLPKSTPVLAYSVLEVDAMSPPVPAQLAEVKNSSALIKRLAELRSEQAETMLIGDTILPQVSKTDKVFAVYRAAPEKNGYLLLVNFASSPQSVELQASELGKLDTIVSKRVILVDSQSPSKDVGLDVNLNAINLGPKQTILVEFSLAE